MLISQSYERCDEGFSPHISNFCIFWYDFHQKPRRADEDHIVSKTYMTRVEGENTRLRHYLARLHRQTLCYSKSVEMLEHSVRLLLHYLKFWEVPVPAWFIPSLSNARKSASWPGWQGRVGQVPASRLQICIGDCTTSGTERLSGRVVALDSGTDLCMARQCSSAMSWLWGITRKSWRHDLRGDDSINAASP